MADIDIESPSMSEKLRQSAVPIGIFIGLAVWLWLGTADVDYREGDWFGGRTTAFWFIISSLFWVPIFAALSIALTWMIRRLGRWRRWAKGVAAAMVGLLLAAIIGHAFVESSPERRLGFALGTAVPAEVRIVRLEVWGTMNEGHLSRGACVVNQEYLARLIARHGLSHDAVPDDAQLYRVFEEKHKPTTFDFYSNGELLLIVEPDLYMHFFRYSQRDQR